MLTRKTNWPVLWGAALLFTGALLGTARESLASVGEFSPDGTQMLASWATGGTGAPTIVTVDVVSGRVRTIATTTAVSGAQWSPDGNWIVYQSAEAGDTATYVYDVRQGRSRIVSRRFGPPYAWREDSRRVAGVARDDDVGLQVVLYNLSERGEMLRSSVPVDRVLSLVWIADTDDLAYLGVADGRTDVYSVEAGETRRISTSGDVLALQLVRSRNELVWARSSKNTRYILLTLYAFDLKSRSVRRLGFPDRVSEINPLPARSPSAVDGVVISPDGDRLAVTVVDVKAGVRSATRQHRLFSVRTNGSGARLIRTLAQAGPSSFMAPFWSRDGRQMGVLLREGGRTVLAAYSADGTGGRVVARSD